MSKREKELVKLREKLAHLELEVQDLRRVVGRPDVIGGENYWEYRYTPAAHYQLNAITSHLGLSWEPEKTERTPAHLVPRVDVDPNAVEADAV